MKGVEIEAMVGGGKQNITIQYDINTTVSLSILALSNSTKKLRRLPHVFNVVLQLPLRSDADVSVEEAHHYFRFVAETQAALGHVEAHAHHIHPGVTKIVVRASGSLQFSLDDLDPDVWRFRLPKSTRPELVTAVFHDSKLIVTVPKVDDDDGDDMFENNTAAIAGAGNLVLVQ